MNSRLRRSNPRVFELPSGLTQCRILLQGLLILPLCCMALHGQTDPPQVAWLDQVQQAPLGGDVDAPTASLPALGPDGQAITTLDHWRQRRTELERWWSEYLGIAPRPQAAPAFRVLEEEQVGEVVRQRIAYDSAPDWPTEAYLLRPLRLPERAPAVVVFHSTVDHSIRQPAGVEGLPEKAFGLALAQRGFVTLCPRNYLWPDNQHLAANEQAARFLRENPGVKGMAKMLSDALVAVDLIAALPYTDAQRIGALGHSLGAKEVLYLAAFDPRVKVAVSSEGGIGTSFSNWDAPWYLGPTIRTVAGQHEHHELLALIAPRPFLLIGGDSADGDRSWPFIEAAMPVYRLFPSQPRLGLLNHRQGHAVPPLAAQRILEWFEVYGKASRDERDH